MIDLDILDLAHSKWPKYHWSKVHRYVAAKLMKVASGEIKRFIGCQPPQTAKSSLIAKCLPALYLLNYPDRNIIITSYDADLARSHSEVAMEIVRDFGPYYGVKLGSRQALSRWNTAAGGQVVAGALGGALTGRPAHLLIIDDPHKGDDEVNSPIMRQKRMRAYNGCCDTRLDPICGAVALLQTRWHPEDVGGSLLALQEDGGDQWDYTCLPALALENDPLGREPGESVWPEKYSRDYYLNVKHKLELQGADYMWEALYMQNPISGNKAVEWPAHYFNDSIWLNSPPTTPVKLRVLALDGSKGANTKAQDGDYQAYVLADYLEDETIYIQSWYGRHTQEAMIQELVSIWLNHPHVHAVGIDITGGQGGYPGLARDYAATRTEQVFPVYGIDTAWINKETRIRQGLSPLLAQGRIKFANTPANRMLIAQAKAFPTSLHDDSIDACELATQLINYLVNGNSIRTGVRLIV